MRSLSVHSPPVQVEVLCKPCGWFLREQGRTYPCVRGHVAQRFGELFTATCEQFSGLWVVFEDVELPASTEPTRRFRCWCRDGNLKATIIIDEQRVDVRWCRFGPADAPLYKRIVCADFEAWRGHDGQPPTRKAFIDLTDAEVETLQKIAAMDAPIPPLRPITNRPKLPNPSAWGRPSAA